MRTLDQVADTLLILEHNHVITLGRKTSPDNFKPQNVPVYEVERGGDATYHGPGQLVGYPILKLEDHDVRKHMTSIEIQSSTPSVIRRRRLDDNRGAPRGVGR